MARNIILFGTEDIPGAAIPKHKHPREGDILLLQTGSAHVWLGDKEYDALGGKYGSGLFTTPSGRSESAKP